MNVSIINAYLGGLQHLDDVAEEGVIKNSNSSTPGNSHHIEKVELHLSNLFPTGSPTANTSLLFPTAVTINSPTTAQGVDANAIVPFQGRNNHG